jgi:hypothetical protein
LVPLQSPWWESVHQGCFVIFMPMLQGVIDFWVFLSLEIWWKFKKIWEIGFYGLKTYIFWKNIKQWRNLLRQRMFHLAFELPFAFHATLSFICHFMPKPILKISLIIKLSVKSPFLSPPIPSFRGIREVMKF